MTLDWQTFTPRTISAVQIVRRDQLNDAFALLRGYGDRRVPFTVTTSGQDDNPDRFFRATSGESLVIERGDYLVRRYSHHDNGLYEIVKAHLLVNDWEPKSKKTEWPGR